MQYEDRFEAVEPLQSWKELWGCEQGMLDFLMCAVTNLFPIPSSFIAWDKEEDASCKRCQPGSCSLSNILTGCQKAPQVVGW